MKYLWWIVSGLLCIKALFAGHTTEGEMTILAALMASLQGTAIHISSQLDKK